jgi:hypothetical protein
MDVRASQVAASVVLPESAIAELKAVVLSKLKGHLKSEDVMAYEDFVEYYKDLSCEVEGDEAFIKAVKALWGL